ncbi:major facilitator superfamily domain-containing protein [Apiospora sp. TS-2023a]
MSRNDHSDGQTASGDSELPGAAKERASVGISNQQSQPQAEGRVTGERQYRGVKWAIVMISLISSTFLYALDNTVLATVRPSMTETLGRIDMLTWLSIAYPMAEVGSNPFWGKLNTQFDNKVLYLIAMMTFETGSTIIGSAPIIEAAIVGRVIAGVGGSGIYVGTMNIVSAMGQRPNANVTVTIYSLPILFQFAYSDSPSKAALWTLPFIGTIVVAAGPLGPLFPKYPVYKVWYLGASVLLLVAGGLMSSIQYSTPRGVICAYAIVQGLGCAPIIQLGFTVGQSKMGLATVGQVSGFMTCAQMGALAISLGIATTVVMNRATQDIAAIAPDLPRDMIHAAVSGVGSAIFDHLLARGRRRVVEAVARDIGKAAGGIGQEIGFKFAEAGAKGVLFADIKPYGASRAADHSMSLATAPGYEALSMELDMTNAKSVQATVDYPIRKFGRVDCCVNAP